MKNKGIIYVLGILLAIILLGGCSAVGTYNGLVSEQTKVEQAQADVATALQRRSDLIGNLVESVKGQMNHRHRSHRRPSHQKNLNLSLTKMNPNRMSH